MKVAVSLALVAILLGMPLACVLNACQAAADPCCPRTSARLTCPYDALDSAKVSNHVAIAEIPVLIGSVLRVTFTEIEPAQFPPDRGDLNILNRVLRI